MIRVIRRSLLLIASFCIFSKVALAIPIGFFSWNVNVPGSVGAFSIVNQTGANHSIFPDTTWPVVTTVQLTGLALGVDFVGGSHTNFSSSYFTLSGDGISFDGGPIPIGGTNPLPSRAVLTGTFTPLALLLNDGTTKTIVASFTSTIPLAPTGLSDGDFAIIDATVGNAVATPEPASALLLGFAIAGFALIKKRQRAASTDVS